MMSKILLEKRIRQEIKVLNDIIDAKILNNESYKIDALRHRILLARLSDLHRLSKFNSNWLKRTVNILATFII